MRARSTIAVAAAVLSLLVVSCSSGSSDGAKGGPKATTTPTFGDGSSRSTTTAARQPVATDQVSINDFAFQPDLVTVKAGTTVNWTNDDSTPHTVTADDGSFDLGPIGPGEQVGQIMTKPGTYRYHCDIHRSMKATIIVTA